jgi:ribosomal-protein-alanine N-acetyltransferase
MLSVNFNPFPILSTQRLILREVKEGDVEEIFFLRSDKRILQHLDREPAKTLDEVLAFIKKINEQQRNNDCILWGISLKEENKLIGTLGFWNMKKEHYRAEIGYVLHPDHQRKGIMNEALAKVLEYGFVIMKLHSVEANVNPDNAASINLLLKNKFIREGNFKENYFFNGNFFDSAIYSLITANQ